VMWATATTDPVLWDRDAE